MLRTPSHLARACGQSHYKKFWLMQTQTDSQDNCVVPSPSVLSFPATTLKGSDGKIIGSPACNPTSWSSATEIAPQGRAAWPAVGSADAGFGGMSNVHRSNVSLSTCAESLTLKRPDISSQLFHLPSEGAVSTGMLDADDENPDVVECRERSSLCSSFSPCVLSSPNEVDLTEQAPNSGTSREIGLSGGAIRSEMDFAHTNPSGSAPDAEPVSISVRDVSEDYNCSTGSERFYREEPLSEASAQGCASKPANGSPSASTESKCPVVWNVSLSLNVGESIGQFKHHAAVERPEDCVAGHPGLCVGRNVMRMCKLCGTTKTPLWRSGPQGPKSLCNACGIRFKKLRRSQTAGECAHVVVSSPSTPLLTKFSARPLKRKSASEKEVEVMKVKSCQRTKRSKWPMLMTVTRNSFTRVEDTESCLTSPGTPPRKQLSHVSRASLERNVSAAELALLEKESVTSALAADVKEAAILLMALSCGLVLA